MTAIEPVVIRVTRFRCPFCKRSASRKEGIRPHIKVCWYNPAARACGSCAHRTHFEGDYDRVVDCTAGRDPYEPAPTIGDQLDDLLDFDDPEPERRRLVRGCPLWKPLPPTPPTSEGGRP